MTNQTPTQSQTELVRCPTCGLLVGVVRRQGRPAALCRHNMPSKFGLRTDCPASGRVLGEKVAAK
jgi:hypothetical protein